MGGGVLATWSQFSEAIGGFLYGFAPWIGAVLAITVFCVLVDNAVGRLTPSDAGPGSPGGGPSSDTGPGSPGEGQPKAAEAAGKRERKPKKPEKPEEPPDEPVVEEPRQMKDPEFGPPPPPIWDD